VPPCCFCCGRTRGSTSTDQKWTTLCMSCCTTTVGMTHPPWAPFGAVCGKIFDAAVMVGMTRPVCYDYFISRFTNRFNSTEKLRPHPNQTCYYQYIKELDLLIYLDFIWQPWCMTRLWRSTVRTECRGSSGPSNLSQGLKPSRSCHAMHTGKYEYLSYISFHVSNILYLVTSMFHFRFNCRGQSTSTAGWPTWL
jgi:hypothetical protein